MNIDYQMLSEKDPPIRIGTSEQIKDLMQDMKKHICSEMPLSQIER